MINRRTFIKMAGASVCLASTAGCQKREEQESVLRSNVVVIFSDEMTLKHLGSYGGIYSTPNLDRLAEEGVRFTQAYSAGAMCTPARFGILTGQYCGRCDSANFKNANPEDQMYNIGWNTHIEKHMLTLGSLFSDSGYTTAFAGKQHNISHDKFPHNLDGFSQDTDITTDEVNQALRIHQQGVTEVVKKEFGFDHAVSVCGNFDHQYFEKLRFHNLPWISKGACEFIDTQQGSDKPFLLYVAPTSVHGPHHGESINYDHRYTPGGYAEDVMKYAPDYKQMAQVTETMTSGKKHHHTAMMDLDFLVGNVLDALERNGKDKDTLVVFLPDHGVEPGKTTCYESGFHIPMLMRWPGKIQANSVCHSLIQSVDILPTLAEATGVGIPTRYHGDGLNQLPVLLNPSQQVREYVYMESGYARAFYDGRYKLIAWRPTDEKLAAMESGKLTSAVNYLGRKFQSHAQIAASLYPSYYDQHQFYDVQTDPHEMNNLIDRAEYANVISASKKRLQAQLKTFKHPFDIEPVPFMQSSQYEDLCNTARKQDVMKRVKWIKRDHDTIVWPPSSSVPSSVQ